MKRKTNSTMALRKNAQNSFAVALFIIRECCRHIFLIRLIWDLCMNLNFRDSAFIIISH